MLDWRSRGPGSVRGAPGAGRWPGLAKRRGGRQGAGSRGIKPRGAGPVQENDLPSAREEGQKLGQGQGQEQAAASQSGQDERRRGWFWHWNSIITQYAPLIGLKGVGLLNSYTVWTDRRDSSPYRGYAFPSQQSEADFYGEDRAELITINKILVALDLIEIRKEMVVRPDERGRRWRVPHNLYRVKDHPEGYQLSSDAVLRVARLASDDRAVYRYLRRVFSQRFAPIDRQNVWHQILAEVRNDPTWRKLAARAEREDSQASARTKAGHAKRRREPAEAASVTASTASPSLEPSNSGNMGGDTVEQSAGDTSVEGSNDGLSTT